MMWEAANAPTRNENLDEGTSGGYHTPPSHDPGRSRHHGHEYGHGHVNSISINSNSRRDHHHGSIPGGRSRHRTISSETVEAALSRLSKAYTSSIECIGAIHKTNQMIVRGEQQQQRNNQSNNIDNNNRAGIANDRNPKESAIPSAETQNRARQTIARVSNAARNTLETAILLDPLMLPHIPFLHQSMLELSQSLSHRPSDSAREGDAVSSSSSASRWNAVNERRPLPPIISSAAHKSTLAKLAYLSLVNYSDLLQQGSGSLQTQTQTGGKAAPATVLDRGIVPRLKSLVSRPPGDNSNSNSNSNNGCWSPEDPEDTQRLAVAALCDAAKLDGSDPIVWLKLACASRRLESVVAEAKARASSPCVMTTLERSRHRRLQVHALQAGSVALPKHMPPNRTILRALEELRAEPEPETYESGGTSPTPRIRTKTMELTRYSWSVLGKMILRACKGEETMAPWEASGSSTSSLHSQASSSLLGLYQKSPLLSLFGSPAVVLKLSPMLVLPSPVLGKICQYLENTSIWKFEATCRALSVNILAARALMEEHNSDDDDDDDDDEAAELLLRQQEIRQKELLQKFESRKSSQEQSKTENDTDLQDKPTNDDDMDIETETKHDDNTNNNSSENSNNNNDNDRGKVNYGTSPPKAPSQPQRQSSRTSKRLRSQQISTGKKQDRTAKRKSFDYCFVAATLSCTKEKHNELARGLRKTSEFAPLFRGGEPPGSTLGGNSGRRKARSSSSSSSLLDAPGDGKNPKQTEARERIGNASLSAFVKRWTYKNSGPMDLLERYLVHVALYVEDVFASDSPTMGLHSCVISAFQTLLLRSGSHQCIVPKFFRPMTETGSLLRSLETFAMDLVYAELILRQCDRYSPKVVEFDDDANLISLMVPGLVESCHQLKEEIGSKSKQQTEQTTILDGVHFQKFHRLEIRCYWLTACFFLWRSRIARAIYMSREAEDEGIHFIGLAIDCFESPNLRSVVRVIKTPHLGSPGREDAYWHEISPESLSKFRDEIQASSVVSHARQRFQELVAQLKPAEETEGSSTKIATEDASALVEIGQKLFERYNSQYGSAESKLVELVENFLEACGGALLSQLNPPGRFERADVVHNDIKDFIQLEPYTVEDLKKVSNPTILSMLVICLNMDESNRLSVAQLLLRLVLTTKDCHGLLLKQIADYRATRKNSDGYQSDDAMSDSDDDMSGIGPQSSQKEDDEKRARQCGHLIKLLIKCLCIALQSYLSEDEKKTLLTSNEFSSMIRSVLDFSNQWYQSTVRFLSIPNDTLDQDLVRLTRTLANESESLRERSPESKSIESIFFRGLVKIVISQHEVLKSLVNSQVDRSHRTARQRLCIKRAHFIGIVASELGTMLSTNLATVNNFSLRKGPLLESQDVSEKNEGDSKLLTSDEEIMFLYAVRWLREFALQDGTESLSMNSSGNTSNSFERPIVKELKIPISILVIGICGSSSCSRKTTDLEGVNVNGVQESCNLSLNEFFDTDASINDWQSDSEDEEDKNQRSKKELLRVICHAIHCVVMVFDKVDEKDIVTKFLENDCDAELGPLLPLVAARVLNFFADNLLMNFGDDEVDGKNRTLLWSAYYPYHARYVGELLDAALHKTYRWQYGFSLVGEQNHHTNTGNEFSHSVNHISEIATRGFKLESTVAAGQLYRCIMRAYSSGRRTPPKQALEAVKAALPPHLESEQSKTLRRFMFSGDNIDIDMNSLLSMNEEWDSPFSIVRDSIVESKDSVDVDGNSSLDEIEATQVRRGLSKQLALGPLPIVTSDSKSKSETGTGDDRAQTICNEIAITKKFNAIVDDLCLSDADNWESWYRAGQCCMMKADAIADRLGLTEGFSRTTHFSIPSHRGSHQRSLEILKLHEEQEREEKMFKEMNLLGHDYSLYINHAWSSFPSLREFTKKMKQSCVNESSEHKKVSLAIWKELDSRYEEGKYLEWQEVCGSLFVAALRNLSARFLSVALYILQSKPEINSDIKVLLSDVCETLGNIFYTELMASQKYGLPMRALTSKRKRDIATTAKACYLASIKHADDSVDEGDDSDDHSTWDLQFMVGKCDEKIAGTYDQEAFVKQTDSTGNNIRLYEQHTSAAMLIYQRALSEATKLEDAGSQLLDSGGSGHGSTELLYRLHASRLKCLIRAVSRKEEERDEAVLEALRLTEKHRFKELDFPVEALESSLNERIWIVFADIVNGLAECRKLKPFFHRSVYRHAQALMWSPVLYNPSSNKGSMDIIPESHSCQIKDLDGSKPVAFSAESVLGVLFDKKRVQLCAVWVTNSGAASPFQAMNSTVRKYDSLRGKYIGAYLETLRICNRRPEVETLMKWLYTSRRDRPSYFQAGAMNCGGKPTVSHSQDSLLTVDSKSVLMSRGFLLSAKRKANGVLADILMHEMSKRVTATASSKTSSSTTTTSSDLNKMTEFYLKHSYACFLRLNCSVEDLGKARAWKYGSTSLREVDAMCQAYLSLGDSIRDEIASTGTSDFGDWSGGGRKSVIFKAALAKCKTLFPTLSANAVFGKSKSKKGKSSSNHTQDAQDPDEFKSGKRKSPSPSSDDMNLLLSEGHPSSELETKKVSFEVAVPVGLTSGDTFLTTVSVAGSSRKVKLRVPEGDHSTLRFNMYVPKSKISQESKKPKLND